MAVDIGRRDVTSRNARYAELVRAVAEPLRRFLTRRTDPDTAEDVLAETLLTLWRRFEAVPTGAELPWAYGVARRQLANAERAARRRDRLVARLASEHPGEEIPGPGDDVIALRSALAELRAPDAEVLRLWAWEGLEAAGIGQVLGITPNAAAIRLHRAKARLRVALGKTADGSGHVRSEGRRG